MIVALENGAPACEIRFVLSDIFDYISTYARKKVK